MKIVPVNGIAVSVLTENEIKQFGLKQEDYIHVDSRGVLFIQNLTRKEALEAAGYDLSKVDFALPQDWIDVKMASAINACSDDPERVFSFENWVWDYSGNDVFGRPLYVGGWKRRIYRGIIKHLIEE